MYHNEKVELAKETIKRIWEYYNEDVHAFKELLADEGEYLLTLDSYECQAFLEELLDTFEVDWDELDRLLRAAIGNMRLSDFLEQPLEKMLALIPSENEEKG